MKIRTIQNNHLLFSYLIKEKSEEIESTNSENEEARSFVSSEEKEEEEDSLRENENGSNDNSQLKHVLYVVWFLFWATCWMIAIELQFGIVFLLFSALLGIYFNTRTGPKRRGEISAYSVFNENCESIQGTLDAKQLEGEMLYGPLYRGVH